ncbi:MULTISPECIES: M23 family metallopeptidase [unclassified Blastococcus]
MSQLHHDPVLDEAAVPAPGSGTPLDGPREAPSGCPAAAEAEVPPTIPAQRSEDAPRRGTTGRARRAKRRRTAVRPDAHLAPAEDLAELSGLAEATALAGLEEVAAAEVPEVPGTPEAAPADDAPDDATAADATADEPERCSVPVVPAGTGRHRPGLVRRRPVLFLAAALVTAAGLGVVTGGDTQAQAEPAETVSESVSVARALGIEGSAAPAPVEADAARLAELASSRASRDQEQLAAAVAQSEADRQATEWLAAVAAEAARPKAVLPVQGARLTSGFGARWGTLHAGIDLAAPMLTPEYAAMDGVVLEAGPASGYGNAVYIQHENGDVTVYGHMEQILVQPGQVVRAGDTIALLGNRGQSTGPHLHFEVHQGGLNGTKIDPIPWLRERGVQI